jgi:hypothetical protein
MRPSARRPSPALIVACIALLVALGGTSYATVGNVPRGSVGTPNLKRNAVTAAKIAPNAVRTAHVLNGTLLVDDFKPGQIPRGPKGDKGDKGDKGEAGAPGLSGYQIVTESNNVVNAGSNSKTAVCPGGKRAIGGGGYASTINVANGPFLYHSSPSAGGAGWTVAMAVSPPQNWTVTAVAICATVP